MGLDQWLYTERNTEQNTGQDTEQNHQHLSIDTRTWRKNHALHEYLTDVFIAEGLKVGETWERKDFNLMALQLGETHLLHMQNLDNGHGVHATAAIRQALNDVKQGKKIYYASFW